MPRTDDFGALSSEVIDVAASKGVIKLTADSYQMNFAFEQLTSATLTQRPGDEKAAKGPDHFRTE